MAVKVLVPVSGGKDSQASLKMAMQHHAPEDVRGLFCDTQFEHPLTYAHVQKMRTLYGPVRIDTVTGGSVMGKSIKYGRFPGGGARHCTDELKIRETRIYCKALAYYFRGEQRNDRTKISGVLLGMLERGEATTPAAYHRAVARQAELTRRLTDGFRHAAYLTLSASGEAPRGLQSPDRPDTCKIWTYLGMPALSVPAAAGANGLPIGLQVVAPKYADYRVLDIGRAIVEKLGVQVTVASPREAGEKRSGHVV